MFLEIRIRKDGQEKWVDAHKFFDYMVKEYSKVKYDGKKVDPYPDKVNTFYDNIPKDLIVMWKKAYPNVDIKVELEKSRAWLLSNTGKAKKDLKRFTNNWLSRAMQNGGSIPVQMEHKIEKQIQERREYMEKSKVEDAAPREEKQEILSDILAKLSKKRGGKK